MADLMNVEIARVGEWKLASGPLDVTPAMLVDAAAYSSRPNARPAPVRLGHGDPRFDGEPALGWLQNLRVEGTGADTVLLGDILDMPDWLAEAAPKHWPERSMEGWTGMEADDGRTYAMVVDGLALLGVTPPGMSSLRSLRDLPQALGVAASARIAATLTPTHSPDPAAGEGSTSSTPNTQGVPMDPVKIREALGLAAEASDEDVTQAIAAAGLAPTTAPPATTTPAAPAAVTTPPAAPAAPPALGPMPTEPPTAEQIAAARAGSGTMVIDAAAWAAREDDIARLKAAEAKRRTEERDTVIGEAIKAGKFPPVRREHWSRVWDKDPEGTRDLIDGLTPNVVPVTAMGEMGLGDDAVDEEYSHLFPPTPKGA